VDDGKKELDVDDEDGDDVVDDANANNVGDNEDRHKKNSKIRMRLLQLMIIKMMHLMLLS
jgi:hypothetical protein